MEKEFSMRINKLAIAATLLMASSAASASLDIGLSNIDITDNGGTGWASSLTWTTTESSNFTFNLDGTSTQTYGTFSTSDFGLGLFDILDYDSFDVSMYLDPPGQNFGDSSDVDADANWVWTGWFSGYYANQTIEIDFDNSWFDMGSYEVRMNDLLITSNGTYNLTIDFNEFEAVPEPSIIALLGLGLVGLGFARRKTRS